MRENIMDINWLKNLLLIALAIYMSMSNAAEKIIIERYQKWQHPVIDIFKKYNVSLYKVSYSKEGTCPTFYAKFKYCPDLHAPSSKMYEKMYGELLKANSSFPYALADEEDNLKINVGWADREKKEYFVHHDALSSVSSCKDGTVNPDNEEFIITSKIKGQIMRSPFKALMHRKDGKEIIAYLYAEDEKSKRITYDLCKNEPKLEIDTRSGHYYIYLYDVETASFFPNRTAILTNFYPAKLDNFGAKLFIIPGRAHETSDALIISQYAYCNHRFYQAYGFWEDGRSFQSYTFDGDISTDQLLGHIFWSNFPEKGVLLDLVNKYGKVEQFKLSVSKNPAKIDANHL